MARSLGANELDEIDHAVAVAVLVIVPRDEFHEGGGQLDAGLGVKDGASCVRDKVGADQFFVSVAQDS